jgi:hypothetical protein
VGEDEGEAGRAAIKFPKSRTELESQIMVFDDIGHKIDGVRFEVTLGLH